ncbi:UDP-N-acetyl-D-glucosamine dehydrogenase [Salinibacter ruber]|uniref:nucleotide sugar dehydrogenase n=1 Tax=Salinibacter ruber TaxID=146919 RepID=UPI002169FC04|nr:nucleotide sugar dehydrogenase [Salinibacter ruber]MCS3642221.1 UDP-N-acetyl-D-glucosamine dehydrogenase [Salinibacter ruber]MCS3821588.1 UDP-N-acetyl-D-glucosamine dehydrogenase [Salinibacter ruber]MCS4182625.1 UDP-N-acetyl-D-glucosamine dehydrogenase [Salinibacter ruber]MCS4189229.1 UDP-N-acetyl-D-glucosamine dehydrogenase [Salinibacter ruber]
METPNLDPPPREALSPNGTAETDRVEQPAAARQLIGRLDTTEATIGVVGLGYVGLPLAVEYATQGFETRGVDLDEKRVGRLNAGDNYIEDLDDAAVEGLVDLGRLSATTHYDGGDEVDVWFLCVPTPVTATNEPDPSYIEAATRAIAPHLRPGQLVVLKSTTYPGTTEDVVAPILREEGPDGLTLGEDIFLAFSPERIDPGNDEYTTANTPVVAGGMTETGTEMARRALGQIIADVHTVSGPKAAEMEKLLENIFRSVNIALANELAQFCERVDGLSMWEVVDAAATKPFGFMPFYPGPGVGGHCIPIDPHYLSKVAKTHDFETSFITLSAQVNEEMPRHVADAVIETIAREPVRLQDAEVLVLGVAFKGNVSDTRRSPADEIVRLLREKGVGQIRYHDPHVEAYRVPGGEATNGTTGAVPSVELTPEVLRHHETTVIVTDHDAFDLHLIAEHAPAIVDTRNALGEVDNPVLRDKITLLGAG